MTNQICIDFPELDQDTYSKMLKILDGIKVKIWLDKTRETIPLKWSGNRLCCPIVMWWDIPNKILVEAEQ